jgi:hypothetical protein
MVHAESIAGPCRGRFSGHFLSDTGRGLWDKLYKCSRCLADLIYMLGKQHMYSACSYCMTCTEMTKMLHIHNICGHNQHTKWCEDTGMNCLRLFNVIRRVADHAGRSAKISSPFLMKNSILWPKFCRTMLSMLGEEVVVVAMVEKVLALEARRPLSPAASPPTRSWSTGRVCGTGVE